MISTKAKRDWIIKNYSPRIAARQGVKDYNGDGKVDIKEEDREGWRLFRDLCKNVVMFRTTRPRGQA